MLESETPRSGKLQGESANDADSDSNTPDGSMNTPVLTRGEKISRAMKGRPSNAKGYRWTYEQRVRLSNAVADSWARKRGELP